jgi:Mannosyl-glycoprotein endo-beta-N-acetylglucosaminidase/LysM domain
MKKLIVVFFVLIQSFCFGQTVTEKYITKYKDLAVQLMNQNSIPASVILGVAIHESASGSSKIARYLNNQFGMKGSNKSSEIKSAYKGYASVEDSYFDFISMMQSRPKFNVLFKNYTDSDYHSWIFGIQKGGYAASKTWAAQVIAIIKKYQLNQFDNTSNPESIIKPQFEEEIKVTETTSYRVKRGDTLNAIAKRFNTSLKSLMFKNNLKSTILQIDQKLII